ncbi:MAG: EF-P lysine aminoacylase GenX [Gammaproteobacteria bacterium]|nr:EF-P lysine aminoacylase GenX [Gammaproteobacteria bacterium]
MSEASAWRPSAGLAAIRRRAEFLAQIRHFFGARGVLEVDTPILLPTASTDPALSSFRVTAAERSERFLQTSPEFAMKRLLAAGCGDIYQVCHVFRREDPSRIHLEEFSLLEWYRVGFDHHRLMDELVDLLDAVGFERAIARYSFAELCMRWTGLDPHRASTSELAAFARTEGARFETADYADRAMLLDFVFGIGILSRVSEMGAFFIYDFPTEHLAYARIRAGDPPVAERFELVIDGIEIANGFQEVVDAPEQRARQLREIARRRAYGLPEPMLDEALLAALESGLPRCAGVALGVDRLLMILTASEKIADVVAFGCN